MPAWADRNSDFRPVEGWVRTRRCRTTDVGEVADAFAQSSSFVIGAEMDASLGGAAPPGLECAEMQGEGHLLFIAQHLAAIDQHAELIHAGFDGLNLVARKRL
jgi:hypothetical protein